MVVCLSTRLEMQDSEPEARATRSPDSFPDSWRRLMQRSRIKQIQLWRLLRPCTPVASPVILPQRNSECERWSHRTFASTSAMRSAFSIRLENSHNSSHSYRRVHQQVSRGDL